SGSMLAFAAALTGVVALVCAQSASAGNIAPNAGFETGPCTVPVIAPILCDWAELGGAMSPDHTNPHSGLASMTVTGTNRSNVEATTINGLCIKITPGAHAASFWYRTNDAQANQEALGANFYPNSTCSVATFAFDILRTLTPTIDGNWHQVTGTITAPP